MCKIERTGKKEQRKTLFVLQSNTTFRDSLHVFTDKIRLVASQQNCNFILSLLDAWFCIYTYPVEIM